MNVREYISSGIIESYVLGLASEAERREFEEMCLAHPEIAEAKTEFEKKLEDQLLTDAKTPPAALKARIFDQLHAPVQTKQDDMTYHHERVVPLRRLTAWRWMAAASILLLVLTVYLLLREQSDNHQLEAANFRLKNQLSEATAQAAELKHDAGMFEKPGIKMASLNPMPVAPAASAKVLWDTASSDVYLIINNLPQPPSDKQYQLWALLNKQPVDLGIFELRQQPLMVRMKGVKSAHAFAITLEPKGGSPAPTGDMYVMGKVE